MGVRYSSLTAVAVGALALGTGCLSPDGKKAEAKKPDVMQPGVLPPPQETTRPVDAGSGSAPGPVVQASATAPAPVAVAPVAPAVAAPAGSPLAKVTAKFERKVLATDFAVGWQNRIAYLPDPVKNGRMSPGVAGQMFLFGGPKLEFAQADGVLTVDLVDDSPRPAGQAPATPERWQFDKNTLRNMQTRDETFGKSYVLFLPWPSYKSDITRVKISARYDPETGPPLFAAPSTITFDASAPFGAPVWKDISKERASEAPTPAPSGSRLFGAPSAQPGAPIPIHPPSGPAPMMPIPGAAAPIALPSGVAPMIPIPNGPIPIPGREGLGAPPVPGDVPPVAIMMPVPPRQ